MDGLNTRESPEIIILDSADPLLPKSAASVNNRRCRAEMELITINKLRIITKVNPWRFKENTKEAGAAWREIVDICKSNGVPMNYDSSKKPAHSLQELVSSSIKFFKKNYPSIPPAGEVGGKWSEKDQLVFRVIKYKENLRSRAVAGKSVIADCKQGATNKDGRQQPSAKNSVKEAGEGIAESLPADSPVSAVEPFDPHFDDNAEIDVESEWTLTENGDADGDGPQDELEPHESTVAGYAVFPHRDNTTRQETPEWNASVSIVLSRVVTALETANEIAETRAREEKGAREATGKFQREEAAKDRALQLELAKITQQTDLQKFKMLLEFSRK